MDTDGRIARRTYPVKSWCGYNVMTGYFNNPEATAASIDTDGWLHTGDIGTLDVDGNIRITDRLKDMLSRAASTATRLRSKISSLQHRGCGAGCRHWHAR